MSINNNTGQSNLEYVEILLEKAADAEQKNTEESIRLSLEALELSKKYHFKKHEARSYVRIGRCHWINGSFNDAIDYLRQALDITEKIIDPYTKADALIGLGNVYLTSELLDQSISHYENALEITRQNGFDKLESVVLNNMGNMHEDLRNYELALEYYQKSLDKTLEIGDTYGSAIAYVNLGNVYFSINNSAESEKYILKSIEYGKENESTLLLAHAYFSLGRISQKNTDYKKSVDLLLTAIEKAQESKDSYILFRIYIELATTYDLLDEVKLAQKYFEDAYQLSIQIKMDELMPRIFEHRAFFFEKRNQPEKAYENYKAYLQASKVVEEKRRVERIKSIEFQSKLTASMEETRIYRQLSNELRRSYQQMHVLSNIGQAMTSTHQIGDIFQQLYENVNLLMNAEGLGVGLYDQELNALRFDHFIEQGKPLESMMIPLNSKNSWSVWSFNHKQTIKINDSEKEYIKYIEKNIQTRGELMYSAMYAPLMVEGEVIGVFSIQAKEKNAYTDTDMDLLQTLASYLAIAIKNAMKTKELAKLNQILKELSERDGLTGIANRRLYDEMYQRLWNKAISNNETLTMMMIDVDNFKNFNDKYGHLTGDQVVKSVASLLKEELRSEDEFVARYGGDEFVMLIPRCNFNDVNKFAKEIQQKIDSINLHLELKEKLTVSIGFATTKPDKNQSMYELITKADEQLYKSKANGKNMISSIVC